MKKLLLFVALAPAIALAQVCKPDGTCAIPLTIPGLTVDAGTQGSGYPFKVRVNGSDLIKVDTNGVVTMSGTVQGVSSTATAGTTTTLTGASAGTQIFTGVTTQTVTLPDATTLTAGHRFLIINRSTGVVTVNKNGGSLALALPAGYGTFFICTGISTAAGTWDASGLPAPTTASLGGVNSKAAASHQFLTSIGTNGAPAAAQPDFTDLTGVATAAQLPNPTASTLGGVESIAVQSSKWLNTISTSGVPAATQPAFTDVSGSVASTQMPALTGDVTTSAGAVATTIAASAVTNAMHANMSGHRVKGNNSGSAAAPSDLTYAQFQQDFFSSQTTTTATPTNGGTVAVDAVNRRYVITAGASVASFTINAPTNNVAEGYIEFVIVNGSGGALTTTWTSSLGFRLAGGSWTDPANGKQRAIAFRYDNSAGVYRELWRSGGDI